MPAGSAERTTFTRSEDAEITGLLDAMPTARLAVQRMSAARLRHMGVPASGRMSRAEYDALVSSGAVSIDEDDANARALITPHPSGKIFRVAIGVTGHSVGPEWSAFDQRYQWFGKKPQSVTSGAHLFALAVDRWRSGVVGLYEAVSAGADKLPYSPDQDRWPWALGVRPLAAIPPPEALRVEGQQGPQSGLPAGVFDERAQGELYAAVAGSRPPPGPRTLEQRVQELEHSDMADDIIEAIKSLGKRAHEPAVLERAMEIGGWTEEELAARAWYTGSGTDSHIELLLGRALKFDQRVKRDYGSGPYRASEPEEIQLGVAYRRAGDRPAPSNDDHVHLVDIAELEKATRRHMQLQDRLADELSRRGIEPRSPASWEPHFDLAFGAGDAVYVVEAKTGSPPSPQQLRIGAGQVLEYCHLERAGAVAAVRPVLLLETDPPEPWTKLSLSLGIAILRGDELERSLERLLDQEIP